MTMYGVNKHKPPIKIKSNLWKYMCRLLTITRESFEYKCELVLYFSQYPQVLSWHWFGRDSGCVHLGTAVRLPLRQGIPRLLTRHPSLAWLHIQHETVRLPSYTLAFATHLLRPLPQPIDQQRNARRRFCSGEPSLQMPGTGCHTIRHRAQESRVW